MGGDGSGRQLDPLIMEEVRVMTLQGLPLDRIAGLLDITPRTVSRHRKRLGISKPPHTRLSQEELDRAAELLADGCTLSETGRTLGRCETAIAKAFPDHPRLTPAEGSRLGVLARQLNRATERALAKQKGSTNYE